MHTLDMIERVVYEIGARADDPEAAHAMEDDLREGILEDIASGNLTLEQCIAHAKAVLKTKDLDFPRWCA